MAQTDLFLALNAFMFGEKSNNLNLLTIYSF